jgi:hypothetical protein
MSPEGQPPTPEDGLTPKAQCPGGTTANSPALQPGSEQESKPRRGD